MTNRTVEICALCVVLFSATCKAQAIKIDVSSESVTMVQLVTGQPAEKVMAALWNQASINAANQILSQVLNTYKGNSAAAPERPRSETKIEDKINKKEAPKKGKRK